MRTNQTLCFLFLLSLLCYSCTSDSRSQANLVDETPEVLVESESSYDVSKLSKKRYKKDIISVLYDEAKKKDTELQVLEQQITDLREKKETDLQAYRKYLNTNSNYWNATSDYISRISDSLLQESVNESFKQLELNYKELIAQHQATQSILDTKEVNLKDRIILMKLFITANMMQNYQKNELPDIAVLQQLVDEYNQTIQAVKEKTPQ